MTPGAEENIHTRVRNLEEEFFRREDQRLLDRLKEKQQSESARDALSKASGITNPANLDKLVALNVRAETVVALSIVPLVEVAWADGKLDDKERKVVLELAQSRGFAPGSVEQAMLEAWLKRRPEPKLLAAWWELVQGMSASFSPESVEKLKANMLERARAVAGASGGVLGLGSKISAAEKRVLERLEKAFVRPA